MHCIKNELTWATSYAQSSDGQKIGADDTVTFRAVGGQGVVPQQIGLGLDSGVATGIVAATENTLVEAIVMFYFTPSI